MSKKELTRWNNRNTTFLRFRFRHKGALVLHSKHVLLLVVILNLVDCSLVLSELILDIHYVKGNTVCEFLFSQLVGIASKFKSGNLQR